MGEFWKDGAYHISTDQKGDLKKYLLDLMTKRGEKTKTGKLSKTGTATKTYIDGEEFVFKSQGGDKWSWRNKSGLRAVDKKRQESIDLQTSGKKDLPKTPSKALEVHHQRMVGLYSPLYEGLSKADGLKLSRYFAEELNMPLGDKLANASTLPMKPHDDIHQFIDENVRKNLPDFKSDKYKTVVLPDGEILEGLDARKFHAKNYFSDLIQPAIDDKTMKFMQGYAEQNPKGYKGLYQYTGLLSEAVASKTRKADLALQFGTGVATGNIAQAGLAGGGLAMQQVLESPAAQKAIARQIAELTAKRGAKTAAKLIPGLDVLISGGEAWGYLRQGKLDQAGIAALSGAIGWIPVVGDGASAALDFTNTGIDISRLSSSGTSKTKNKKQQGSGVLTNPAMDKTLKELGISTEYLEGLSSSGFGNRQSVNTLLKTLK